MNFARVLYFELILMTEIDEWIELMVINTGKDL